MISPEQKKCNQCFSVFNKNKSPLKMPTCKHNICQNCLQQIRHSKYDSIHCQFCSSNVSKISNKKFQPNKILSAKLKEKKSGENSPEKQVYITSSFKVQQSIPLDLGDIMLIDDDDGSAKKQTSKNKRQQHQICPQHQKPYQIICITDLRMICPHCAIFGNHKDHCFKTLKQFNRDYQQSYQKLQIIKQQKYIYDKKNKNMKQKQSIQASINQKKTQLRAQISKTFQKYLKQLQNLQASICQELNKSFSSIYNQITSMLEQQNKIQQQFQKWESQCQNYLATVDKTNLLNQKIKILYSSTTKLGHGQELVDKLEKRLQANMKKLQGLVSSIKVEYKEQIDFSKLIKVAKKQQQGKKDNFMLMIQKINLPNGKHILQDIDTFNDNSFITDYSKQDLSLVIESQSKQVVKKSAVTKRSPRPTYNKITSSTAFKSPVKSPSQTSQTLVRHKSNNHIRSQNSLLHNLTDLNVVANQTKSKIEARDPDSIIQDFITHDLKQVLDLTRCELTDSNLPQYIKQVRKHRKIRGLKLCQNYITDAGFLSIIQFLGSTSNLNLSYNKLTENILSIIIENRDKLSPLRIVNLSFNLLNEKKSKPRADALKKMGIIINM